MQDLQVRYTQGRQHNPYTSKKRVARTTCWESGLVTRFLSRRTVGAMLCAEVTPYQRQSAHPPMILGPRGLPSPLRL